MLVLKARVTFAWMCTTFPSLIGLVKEILSTDAVTTGAPQCLLPESAAAMSIQYISRPPIKLSNRLVSLGKTNSVITIKLSEGFLAFILQKFLQIWLMGS